MLPNAPLFYVDDDTDDLEIFFEVASSLGIETILFNRGDKLLFSLLNPPPKPSVIFVDLNMPLMSGFDIMKELKSIDFLTNIPIVVFSTANDESSIEKSKKLGASYYVVKPNSYNGLKRILSHINTVDWTSHNAAVDFLHKN